MMKLIAKAVRPPLTFGFLLLFLCGVVSAQRAQPLKSVNYRLAMSRPVSHLFEVAIEVELPQRRSAVH